MRVCHALTSVVSWTVLNAVVENRVARDVSSFFFKPLGGLHVQFFCLFPQHGRCLDVVFFFLEVSVAGDSVTSLYFLFASLRARLCCCSGSMLRNLLFWTGSSVACPEELCCFFFICCRMSREALPIAIS